METQKAISRGEESILFVDDEEVLAQMGKLMLERLGYRVETSTNPLEALEKIRNGGERFDLVITDQTMPFMTGAALAAEIMALDRAVPVILCTGFSEAVSEENLREAGIRALVMKPFILKDFAQVVRDILDGK